MTRPGLLLVALLVAVALAAGSTPRLVGDGGEYFAMAVNLAAGRGPSLAAADVPELERRVEAVEPHYRWDITASTIEARGGRRDFVHFWGYSLLAAPLVRLADATGVPPLHAFTVLNAALLLGALALALGRLTAGAALLLFASPLVWWIDKPHTEPLTFALLTAAMLCLPDRPAWSLAAAGAAAVQNPPVVALFVLILAAEAIKGRAALLNPRLAAGAVAGLALAAAPVAYTWPRHGTVSLLLDTARPGLPHPAEIAAPLADANVGLLPNFPWLVLIAVAAAAVLAVRARRDLLRGDVLVAAGAAAAFLLAFAGTPNVHHGGTPSLSRYALWLIPLSIPLLRAAGARSGRWWNRFVLLAAAGSAAASLVAFHPRVAENAREPTWLARYLWTERPAWSRPLPEVFMEVLRRREDRWAPVFTPGCEKILTVGRGDDGVWPMPCYPEAMPEWCRTEGVLCYANRQGNRYAFSRAPGRPLADVRLRRDVVWPTGTEAHGRALLTRWAWWTLRPVDGPVILREGVGVRVWAIEGAGRYIFLLRDVQPGAVLRFRPAGPLEGVLADGRTGLTLAPLGVAGPGEALWSVEIPQGYDLLLLMLAEPGTG